MKIDDKLLGKEVVHKSYEDVINTLKIFQNQIINLR
jgi:hypothetical protein